MHVKADLRIDQMREMKPFILESLPYKPVNPQETGNKRDLVIDGSVYDEFENPIDIMSQKIITSMSNYQNSFSQVPDLEYLSKRLPSFKQTNSLI